MVVYNTVHKHSITFFFQSLKTEKYEILQDEVEARVIFIIVDAYHE